MDGDRSEQPAARATESDDYGVRLASAKLVANFVNKSHGELNVETDSVYGAAILLPQLARSAGWPKFLVICTFRTFIFHVLNICVQGALLVMIAKEENIMDLFAGQMYLCDFGAWLTECPDNPGCTGPGGTPVTAPRMYPFGQWSTRNFVRDSLKSVFPERASTISKNVDPGEYGVESYGCRWLCCFIYMMSVMNELFLIIQMWSLLVKVPRSDESWIDHADDEVTWADSVRVQVAGMPAVWKAFNFVFVLLPKCLLWKITAEAGITLLMETSSIEDLIVNSVALSFVLNIDEMFCENLMSDPIKFMLERCEGMPLGQEDDHNHTSTTDEELLETHMEEQSMKHLAFSDLAVLFPPKFIATFVLTAIFVFEYYWTHCQWSPEHRWFSVDMHLPRTTQFTVTQAFFPRFFQPLVEDEPYWQMPKPA